MSRTIIGLISYIFKMVVLGYIFITLVILLVLVLLASLFIKKDYIIEKHLVIIKSKEKVFDYIKHLKNMEMYNKWLMADSKMKKNYKDFDGRIGFIYA